MSLRKSGGCSLYPLTLITHWFKVTAKGIGFRLCLWLVKRALLASQKALEYDALIQAVTFSLVEDLKEEFGEAWGEEGQHFSGENYARSPRGVPLHPRAPGRRTSSPQHRPPLAHPTRSTFPLRLRQGRPPGSRPQRQGRPWPRDPGAARPAPAERTRSRSQPAVSELGPRSAALARPRLLASGPVSHGHHAVSTPTVSTSGAPQPNPVPSFAPASTTFPTPSTAPSEKAPPGSPQFHPPPRVSSTRRRPRSRSFIFIRILISPPRPPSPESKQDRPTLPPALPSIHPFPPHAHAHAHTRTHTRGPLHFSDAHLLHTPLP
ncbi:vegetative cell wall protein gp1-like [Monodon monoceros]|uniref:vegetative cell wall protein gp1-like n=1 Tax=Monodon monoceros TaxID=40151 RepID=UPI0010F9FF20|nr:vegetative cell wall protein gp1-like [Monodon monoceros]